MVKLLVWGTGNFARKFINNGYGGEIIGFIETHKSADRFMDRPVFDSRTLNLPVDDGESIITIR